MGVVGGPVTGCTSHLGAPYEFWEMQEFMGVGGSLWELAGVGGS